MTAASPNNYGTISRWDGEVRGVRGSAAVTGCNICLLRPEQTVLGLNLEDDDDDDDEMTVEE